MIIWILTFLPWKKKTSIQQKFKQRLGFVLDGVSNENGGNSCYIKVCHGGSMSLKPNLIYEINSSPFLFCSFKLCVSGWVYTNIFLSFIWAIVYQFKCFHLWFSILVLHFLFKGTIKSIHIWETKLYNILLWRALSSPSLWQTF